MEKLFVGIDAGATSVKLAALNEKLKVVFSSYERHKFRVDEVIEKMIQQLKNQFPGCQYIFSVTGVQGSEPVRSLQASSLTAQETLLLYRKYFVPEADVIVEMGGESSRMTFFRPSIVQRENRRCAAGTGAFLDNLACLFHTDTAGLGKLAEKGKRIYPIASRCGAFAKTDVQSLLNEGAGKEDLALSVFNALAVQTLSDLLRGRAVTGKVVLLGGPFAYLRRLSEAFYKLLGTKEEQRVIPLFNEFYGALGAAAFSRSGERLHFPAQWVPAALRRLQKLEAEIDFDETCPPLFENESEYQSFCIRHEKEEVPVDSPAPGSPLWLGIDAGSTTMKSVLINEEKHIVASRYGRHGGDVVHYALQMVRDLLESLPGGCHIAGAGATGYGEDLVRTALQLDFGEVETMAHLKAARYFCPDLTSLLDIGGQDMKYMHLNQGHVDQVLMNGICSSGCGAFLETFAGNMGLTVEEFTQKALHSGVFPHYGLHCTVLMNSRIYRPKKTAAPDEMAAGLCYAVVENALKRVLRLESPDELGDRLVVEGGTFCNDAVLRAFEKITGKHVIRPRQAGLMGAYGIALYGRERYDDSHRSSMISPEEMETLSYEQIVKICGGCGNHCHVSIYDFGKGRRFGTGYRCETGAALAAAREKTSPPDVMQWVKDHVFRIVPVKGKNRGIVGIPMALSMWSDFPFWAAFWSSLGYEVKLSRFSRKAAERAILTIPRRVHCHACLLAHSHVEELLTENVDFIWFPAMRRGKRNDGTDEMRHAHYPRILGLYMKSHIMKAGADYVCPTLPELKSPALIDKLEACLPFAHEEIMEAVQKGLDNLDAYEKAYAGKTAETLSQVRDTGKAGVVLLTRQFQNDPQINKGLPSLITGIGAAVLTADGLYLLKNRKKGLLGTRSGEIYWDVLPDILADSHLIPVPLYSLNCGMDMDTVDKIKHVFRKEGRPWMALSIDQGTNTGPLKIRMRTILAEQ